MKFKILGHTWNIVKKSELEMNEITNDMLGVTRFPNREIYLLESLKDESLKQVVRHEFTHALMDEFGLAGYNSFNAEFICDFMANNMDIIDSCSDWVIRHF